MLHIVDAMIGISVRFPIDPSEVARKADMQPERKEYLAALTAIFDYLHILGRRHERE